MEGFAGIVRLLQPHKKSRQEVEEWCEAFAQPSFHKDQVSSWANERFAVAWRANPAVGDLHIACEDGIFTCLIGQMAVQGKPILNSSDLHKALFGVLSKMFVTGSEDFTTTHIRNLTGSFLLLTYDIDDDLLFVINDPFSSRPLFYYKGQEEFVFSTDIRALLADPRIPRQLNYSSVVEFIQCSMIFEDRTLYENLYVLPPASVLKVNKDRFEIEKYWSLAFVEECTEQEDYYVEALAHHFLQATERLVPDSSNVGLMLSGGLDSRMIAACLKAQGKEPTAISFGDFENKDVRLAIRVAETLGFEFAFIGRHPEYYRDIMLSATHLSNGLYSYYHAHMLGLGKDIRNYGIRTLVNGWGIDIPFSGSYLPRKSLNFLGRTIPILKLKPLAANKAIANSLLAELRLPMDSIIESLSLPEFALLWKEWPQQEVLRLTEAAENHASNPYNQLDYILISNFVKFRSYLYPMSVRPYARERSMLFDNDLLRLYLSMPPNLRFNSRVYRKALQTLNPRLAKIPYMKSGVPLNYPEWIEQISYIITPFIRGRGGQLARILGRHKQYPAAVYDSYPGHDPLVRHILRDDVKEILLHGKYLELGLLDADAVAQMPRIHVQGHGNYGKHLVNLTTFALWIESQDSTL